MQKRVYRNMVADTIAPDHFLKKVFKKKPGGTVIGNLIRVAANKATGGILGTGANRLPVVVQKTEDPAPWLGGGEQYKKPIQEVVQQNQSQALKQSLKDLPGQLLGQLIENQTGTANLPKTAALRDAERAAENMKNETIKGAIGSGGGINPLYILGILAGVLVLFMFMKKAE